MSAPADPWASLPLGRGVTVVARSAHGLAGFSKPAGLLSHPNDASDRVRSLISAPYTLDGEYYEWAPRDGEAPRRLWLLNRLDSATSGVILLALDESLAKQIRAAFRAKTVRKVYQALVFGNPPTGSQTWRDRLAVARKGGVVRAGTGGNIPAESVMTALRRQPRASPPRALIRLEPRTGRSHQLRVQCAKRHLPIVGDATYGNFPANRAFAKETGEKRLFLHSLTTEFDYEVSGRRHHFEATAPLPPEFIRHC